jgi:hypothetical protein
LLFTLSEEMLRRAACRAASPDNMKNNPLRSQKAKGKPLRGRQKARGKRQKSKVNTPPTCVERRPARAPSVPPITRTDNDAVAEKTKGKK